VVCVIIAGAFAVGRQALADLPPWTTASDSGDGAARRAKLPGRVVGLVGVASFNADGPGRRAAKADWDRITRSKAIDLIGWQESASASFRALLPRYRERGWDTWYHQGADGPTALAISWRREVLSLERVRWWRIRRGGFPQEATSPSHARWVAAATFRHRASGLELTLINTHVNQLDAKRGRRHLAMLEGLWDTMPGDVVLGTGDYSSRQRGGITRRIDRLAVSSYEALGRDGMAHAQDSRRMPYVFVADGSVRRHQGTGGLAQFVGHRLLSGFDAEQAPLLARVRLYAPQ
jgi:hypothetical protein